MLIPFLANLKQAIPSQVKIINSQNTGYLSTDAYGFDVWEFDFKERLIQLTCHAFDAEQSWQSNLTISSELKSDLSLIIEPKRSGLERLIRDFFEGKNRLHNVKIESNDPFYNHQFSIFCDSTSFGNKILSLSDTKDLIKKYGPDFLMIDAGRLTLNLNSKTAELKENPKQILFYLDRLISIAKQIDSICDIDT